MYICLCHKVSEKDIRESLSRGVRPADLVKRFKVGDSCGICLTEAIKEIESSLNCHSENARPVSRRNSSSR